MNLIISSYDEKIFEEKKLEEKKLEEEEENYQKLEELKIPKI